jgi:hypothetical protein
MINWRVRALRALKALIVKQAKNSTQTPKKVHEKASRQLWSMIVEKNKKNNKNTVAIEL